MTDEPETWFQRDMRTSFESFEKEDRSFDCRLCKARFTPAEGQWIFYELCDTCFPKFNAQKMTGRFGALAGEKTPHFEDVAEWIAHVQSTGSLLSSDPPAD